MAARLGLSALQLTDALRNSVAFGSRSARQPTRLQLELFGVFGVFGAKGCGALNVFYHPMTLWGLPRRYQMHGTIANEIAASNLLKCFTQGWPVVRVVIAKKRLMESALFNASDRRNPFAVTTHFFERILLAVIHRRRQGHWGWVERLHLICAKLVALEPQGQVDHVIVGGSRVRSDEVRD